jgi:hypothetical protein
VILFNGPMAEHCIVTAYDKGIVQTFINREPSKEVISTFQKTEIEDFQTANSFNFNNNLFFTKDKSNLLYVKSFQTISFPFNFNQTTQPDILKYYKKPSYLVNADALNSVLTYARATKNGVNLYAMNFKGESLSNFDRPILKNMVLAKNINSDLGFVSINKNTNHNYYDVSMLRDPSSYNITPQRIDTISTNLDSFGSVPAIAATTYNQEYTVIYTSYDNNHKGILKLCHNSNNPKVILSNENIFGPIAIEREHDNKTNADEILYFTLENNHVHVKICDANGKLIKDVSSMLALLS